MPSVADSPHYFPSGTCGDGGGGSSSSPPPCQSSSANNYAPAAGPQGTRAHVKVWWSCHDASGYHSLTYTNDCYSNNPSAYPTSNNNPAGGGDSPTFDSTTNCWVGYTRDSTVEVSGS